MKLLYSFIIHEIVLDKLKLLHLPYFYPNFLHSYIYLHMSKLTGKSNILLSPFVDPATIYNENTTYDETKYFDKHIIRVKCSQNAQHNFVSSLWSFDVIWNYVQIFHFCVFKNKKYCRYCYTTLAQWTCQLHFWLNSLTSIT